jgi:hypothetical protein
VTGVRRWDDTVRRRAMPRSRRPGDPSMSSMNPSVAARGGHTCHVLMRSGRLQATLWFI